MKFSNSCKESSLIKDSVEKQAAHGFDHSRPLCMISSGDWCEGDEV
jgi:hypothetical protein